MGSAIDFSYLGWYQCGICFFMVTCMMTCSQWLVPLAPNVYLLSLGGLNFPGKECKQFLLSHVGMFWWLVSFLCNPLPHFSLSFSNFFG